MLEVFLSGVGDYAPPMWKFPQFWTFEPIFIPILFLHILIPPSSSPSRAYFVVACLSLPQSFFARVHLSFSSLFFFTAIEFVYSRVVLCLTRPNGGSGVSTRTTSRASANFWRNFLPSSYLKSRRLPFCFRSWVLIKPTLDDDDPTTRTKDENICGSCIVQRE